MTDEELIARLREAVNGEHDMTPHGADCLQAADRIEALTAKVKLMDDLDVINGEKIEGLTAKLAKAVEGLREIAGFAEKEWVTPSGEAPPDVQNLCDIARTIIAEIEGSNAP
jgi:hypothetical protein